MTMVWLCVIYASGQLCDSCEPIQNSDLSVGGADAPVTCTFNNANFGCQLHRLCNLQHAARDAGRGLQDARLGRKLRWYFYFIVYYSGGWNFILLCILNADCVLLFSKKISMDPLNSISMDWASWKWITRRRHACLGHIRGIVAVFRVTDKSLQGCGCIL